MSKRILKRSLALGALMAFVITGSAMAADGSVLLVTGSEKYSGTEINADTSWEENKLSEDDGSQGKSYALGVNTGIHIIDNDLEITNNLGTARNYGIAVQSGAQLTINGNVTVISDTDNGQIRAVRLNGKNQGADDGSRLTINGDLIVDIDARGDMAYGVDSWNGKTVINGNANIDVFGSNFWTSAVQVGYGSVVEFNGSETLIDSKTTDSNTAQGVWTYDSAKNEVHFNSAKTTINATSKYGVNGIVGGGKVVFNGKEATINATVSDGQGCNAVGIGVGNLEVTNNVEKFNIIVNGSGTDNDTPTADDGTAAILTEGRVVVNASEFSITVNSSENDFNNGSAAPRDKSYGIRTFAGADVDVNSDVVSIIVNDNIKTPYAIHAFGSGTDVKVSANKANIKGIMYAGNGATLDISGINDLVLEGLTTTSDAAIQVNGGTLKVNTAGTLEIKDAGAGTYKVASGVDSILWKDENLVYDRTTLLAKGILEEQDYKVEYDAFDASTATDEQLKEAQQQIVTATGGEELAVPSLVGSVAGAGTVMEETAKGAKEFLGSITSNAEMPKETKAAVINSAAQLAEAGGNAGTAVSVANNVAGVTTGRMSFGGRGHGGHKGGHGVGMFEEGSGAAVWAQYMHGKDDATDMPMDGGATSYESEYDGIVLGVDFKKVGKFQSGIAFNYGEGDSTGFTSAAKTQSDYDFWGIGYYGNIRNDDTNFIFDVNYAKSDSDVTQNNVGATDDIEASPETTTWSAGVKVEKLYQNESVQIVPYTGLRYMSIDTDEYTSKLGGETLFNYAPERQDIWLLPLGVTIKQEVVNDNGWVVTPKVDLSYIWAFGDTDSNMSVSIPGIAASNDTLGFTVMDDGSFLGLVGVEAKLDDWTFGVSYSYQKGDYAESKKWFIDAKYSF